MQTDRIDFISAYCDRWCDRCAYTARCSAFATHVAIAMCGDTREGIELAVGAPRLPSGGNGRPPDWRAGFEYTEPTAEEMAEITRKEDARRARLDEAPIMKVTWAISMLAHRWFMAREEAVRAGADPVLTDALEVAHHDEFFITVKLRRALDGRDRHEEEGEEDDDLIQNDWNGSAKVALISIERSEAAWRVIAGATGDDTPMAIADELRDLHRLVDVEFPNVWRFVRPGFDEPGR